MIWWLIACSDKGEDGACPEGQVLVDGDCVSGGTTDDTGTPAAVAGRFVTAGQEHTCLLEDGAATCWGNAEEDRLEVPDVQLASIDANEHTCGLQADGEPVCWGPEDYNENFVLSGDYQSLSTGVDHACGVSSIGAMVCWGSSLEGQATTPDGKNYSMVDAGEFHSCALRNKGQNTVCWGRNDDGQTDAPNHDPFAQISAGGVASCGLAEKTGEILCWGHKQVTDKAPSGGGFVQISVGRNHACALDNTGAVTCWGANLFEQTTVPGGIYTQVSAGALHTCALDDAGTVVCWGDDRQGQANPP